MEVHREEGTISWAVNQGKPISCKVPILKETNRIFVPFIEMCDQEDTV